MPFFHQQSRADLRQMYVAAWRKRRERRPVEPLEAQIADVIQDHPEYHSGLEQTDSTDRDDPPDNFAPNPFLHMGLHLALRDQLATDRPPGIRDAFAAIAAREPSAHDAEHILIECLAAALWHSQRRGLPPDEAAYLECIRRHAR